MGDRISIVALVCLTPLLCTSAPILDQLNVVSNGGCGSIPGGSEAVGQTYTAGRTGTLAGIALSVFPNSIASGCMIDPVPSQVYPLNIAIMSFDSTGTPSMVVGQVTVSTDQLSFTDVITFPMVIAQVAGGQYAILLSAPTAPSDVVAAFWSAALDTYTGGGDFILYSSTPGDWSGVGDVDYAFQTFVESSEVPEPSTYYLLATGIVALWCFRRSRSSSS